MSMVRALETWRARQPARIGFDTNVQKIASAAHLRGVHLLKGEVVVGTVEAAVLCRTLRAAHESTRGNENRHDDVERLANAIAVRLGVQGAVGVARAAWAQLQGYAERRTRTRQAEE